MGDHDHTPLCSVIVPLYNKEQTIRDCLASALTQSISDLEVLVIDDGSTDAGAAVVEELAREDERLTLIHQENAGPSAARNAGLERAQGACVCFLDADDLLAPGFLEELIACMKREHTEVARCAQLFTDPQGRQRVRSSSDQDCSIPGSRLYRRLFAELEVPLMSAWSALYKRDFLRRHQLDFDPGLRHLEDVSFVARLYARDARVAFSSKALYLYQQGTGRSLSEERGGLIEALPVFVGALEKLESTSMVATTERQMRLHYCAIVALTAIASPAPGDDPFLYRDFLRSETVVRIIAVARAQYLPKSLLVARGLARLESPQLLNAYCAGLARARKARKRFKR